MTTIHTRLGDAWTHLSAFLDQFDHARPLLETDLRFTGWWLPALTHLAQKDMGGADSTGQETAQVSLFADLFVVAEPTNFQTVEQVFDVAELQSTSVLRNDGTQREDFQLDDQTVAIRYTNVDADVAWDSVTNYYDAGERVSKLTTYDTGVMREDTFANGQRVKTLQRDQSEEGGAKAWTTVETQYDPDGTLTARTTQYDNGTSREETFDGGLRSVVTQNDVENVFSWTEITTQYTATSGQLSQRSTRYDDGMERVDFYDSGTLSVVTKVDAPNTTTQSAYAWSNIIQFHDNAGQLVSRGTTFDDGMFRGEDFDAGLRTLITEQDFGNTRSWRSIERAFDTDGVIASRRIIDDTLDDTIMFYDSGKRDTRIEMDGNGSDDWQFRITTYDPETDTDNAVTTYANITDLPEIYASLYDQDALI